VARLRRRCTTAVTMAVFRVLLGVYLLVFRTGNKHAEQARHRLQVEPSHVTARSRTGRGRPGRRCRGRNR